MEWFRHDLSAHDDIKIRKLLYKYGVCAYGAFWVIVELLYKSGGTATKQEIEDEFEMMNADGMKDILAQSGLFDISESGSWSSKRVNEEIFYQEDSRRKKSEAGKKGMASRWNNGDITAPNNVITDDNRPITPDNTIPNHTNKKDISLPYGNSISKEKRSSVFRKPSVEEVRTYCAERGNSVDAETFVNFYESKGWKVGNTPMKDWQAAVRTWERSGSRAPQAQTNTRKKMETDKAIRSRAVNPDGTLNLLGGKP